MPTRTSPTSLRRPPGSVQVSNLIPALLLALVTGCSGFVASFTGEDLAQEIRAVGVPAEATVLRIWETGVRVNDNPVVGFLLEVRAPDREPWEAETKALVSILDIPQIQPGTVLGVVYDPADPSRVALGAPDGASDEEVGGRDDASRRND